MLTSSAVDRVKWSGVGDITAAVAQLREMAQEAESPAEAQLVIRRIAEISREFRIKTGIGLPTSPLLQAREFDGSFRVLPHLEYLSERFSQAMRDVERGKNRRITVSMPPRAGKSELISKRFPLWTLRRHPDWKIVQASYSGGLVSDFVKWTRMTIEDKPDLGIALSPYTGARSSWSTVEGGGIYTTSVRGGLTGRGARVVIIDDPIKDFIEAHSLTARQTVWDWWLSVVQTRLEPPYLVVVVACMTGDTPVLRPDGSETPLADLRPGDEIATYEDGSIATSVVKNWINHGPDNIHEIRMKSGLTVRANARHPFLVRDSEGNESWVRLQDLSIGDAIVRTTRPEGHFEGSSVQPTGVSCPRGARGCASRTTTSGAGHPGIAHPRPGVLPPAPPRSSTAMESLWRGTKRSSQRSRADVLSVLNRRLNRTLSDEVSSSSIMSNETESRTCEACSATTATSFSRSTSLQSVSERLPTTWSITADEIVEIVDAGVEDVFDIEVERTENFIANGLVSHNTRWHEDDFIGRLLSPEYEGDPSDWEEIRLPAIAEIDDSIGRLPGDPLYVPMLQEGRGEALDRWDDIRRQVGSYTWSALYQQRPAPARGSIFDIGWFRFWTSSPEKATDDGRIVYLAPEDIQSGTWIDSWDCAFKGSSSHTGAGAGTDFVVAQRWVRQGANRYLIAGKRGRWSFTQTIQQMVDWTRPDDPMTSYMGHMVHERLIEDTANGPAIIDTLRERISGLKPVKVSVGKEARARAITPECESGNVYLPLPSDPGNDWVQELLSEIRNFPHDANDDQVDAMVQALARLRDSGRGGLTVPGAPAAGRPGRQSYQAPRDIARTALRDMGRRRY